ncbi:hypothetical protein [Cribrihabitans neustonicus]|uniref:hypothetical protein n=1 Tax=Cribrihabitans neustonicus TaxID=1429085 RepID=UPI003B597C1E
MTQSEENGELAAGRTRVILGASCYPDAEAALQLAMELAGHLGAELQGVFVRETALLAATYSYARVVTYSGQQETGLSAGAMARALQADSRRFQGLLARRARAAALPSSFLEAEGHLQDALRRAARAGDLLVFGFKPMLRAAGCLALILAEGQGVPDYAARLARRTGKPLVALIACTGPAGAQGTGPQDASGSPIETRRCTPPETLLRHLEHMSPAAVIVAAPPAGLPSAARIQEAARCPVVIRCEG